MALPAAFADRLHLPAISAPMFLVSGTDLVVEVCRAGLIGTFPALNGRTSAAYRDWLTEIEARLAEMPGAAPHGVNLIVHRSNPRLAADLEITVEKKVPLVITSLGAVRDVIDAVHAYGGLVFHDVVNLRHARKAIEAGVDGIIAVAAGAGGHAGVINPFALVSEIRAIFSGTLVLAGAINNGAQIAAARMMGADMAYLGTRFIATRESMATPEQKRMLLESAAADIVYTPAISGVPASFLRPSLVNAGLDPDNLPAAGHLDMGSEARAWKDVWSAGQGVGGIGDVPGAGALCRRLCGEYADAIKAIAADRFATRPN